MIGVIGVGFNPHAFLNYGYHLKFEIQPETIIDLAALIAGPVIDLPRPPIYRLQDYMRSREIRALKMTIKERIGSKTVTLIRRCKGLGSRKDHYRWHHPKFRRVYRVKKVALCCT